jgi:hypothetical protein
LDPGLYGERPPTNCLSNATTSSYRQTEKQEQIYSPFHMLFLYENYQKDVKKVNKLCGCRVNV